MGAQWGQVVGGTGALVPRLALAALLAVVVGASTPAAVAAAPREARGLHDLRYCEIIALRGAPPDATAVVWNTVGLNRCPAARWEAFDAAELARDLRAGVVVLNGPRHFLMDAARGETGGVRSFDGLRMRRVATIPIRTAADLVQRPYAERTIARRNLWRWERGRRIYELVAPGGASYVMQSYAQIRDPGVTLGALRALGQRLQLPPGWRYRSRTLRRPLELVARGRATIVQDELQNTYQRRPRSRPRG